MPLLSTLAKTVARALGVPQLVSTGIKRVTSKLLTLGLKQIGFDTSAIEDQARQLFKEPLSRDISRTIAMTAERMDLMQGVGQLSGELPFSRSNMFETSFRKDRNYRFFAYVHMYDSETGRPLDQWISFYADDNLSKDQIADRFEAEIMKTMYGESYSLQAYNVFEVWHNEGNPY